MKWTSTVLVTAALVLGWGCNGRPSSTWLSQPQFTIGLWEVYHDPFLLGHELVWIRQAVAAHIALSESTLPAPWQGSAPRWRAKGLPYIVPKIYVYDAKVARLNSPIRIGVHAYADFKREEVHCVQGFKLAMPGLAAAIHQLRLGPDVWHQDPALGWSLLFPAQDRLVDLLERTR